MKLLPVSEHGRLSNDKDLWPTIYWSVKREKIMIFHAMRANVEAGKETD
jgi:hypothetical protein